MTQGFEQYACKVSSWFASPLIVAAFPLACILWLWLGFSVDDITLLLSVLAISMTQLVLVGQARESRAVKAEVDEILRAIPEADDSVAQEA
jgi:low affinity Fe/Cu permease